MDCGVLIPKWDVYMVPLPLPTKALEHQVTGCPEIIRVTDQEELLQK